MPLGHSGRKPLRRARLWINGLNGQSLILLVILFQTVFLALWCAIPPSQRDYTAITAALGLVEKELAIADKVLATNAYLAGDDFSLADIQLGHCLYRYYDIDVRREPICRI